MTDAEFASAAEHHTQVLNQIREVLDGANMRLVADGNDVVLVDDGRGIGYTGFTL